MTSNRKNTLILILLAYLFSLIFRYIYIYQAGDNPEFFWNGSYIINTNDGYFFANGVQKALYEMHQDNYLVPGLFDRGLVFVTYILVKILPFSLETIIFYLPAFISSLIVIPMVLIGALYNRPLWGFWSAVIASIAWSYYNRTMLGYYDTDMFSITFLMFIVYFLLKSIKDNSLETAFIASVFIIIYPFLYQSGKTVSYAIIIFYAIYILFQNKFNANSLKIISLIFIASTPIPLFTPYNYIASFIIVAMVYTIFKKTNIKQEFLSYIVLFTFLILIFQGDIFSAIINKVFTFLHRGTEEHGLKFFGVYGTIAEAEGIPFFASGETNSVANRIIGSSIGFILAIIGYIYLVYKKREFLILLPLVGLGIFSHWGGLRFTIYAVPILALSFVYLLFEISIYISKSRLYQLAIVSILSIAVLIPNITHALYYNKYTTPVFKNSAIKQLDKLKHIAKSKDYTLSWWDYGYPIVYYTNTNTLIDGGKHSHDNYIISKILLSTSPQLAANLARLSVEEYVKANNEYKKWINGDRNINSIPKEYKFLDKDNKPYFFHDVAIDLLLRDNQKDQKDYYDFIASIDKENFNLPQKTRDIYLYMPTKSIRVFPAIVQFSNIDLNSGNRLRDVVFYNGYIRSIKDGIFTLSNGIQIDSKSGLLNLKGQAISKLVVAEVKNDGSIDVKSYSYPNQSNLAFLYLKSYGIGILLDNETLNSNYVKMFLLGKYDKNLFELVDSSIYGRIYKLKK